MGNKVDARNAVIHERGCSPQLALSLRRAAMAGVALMLAVLSGGFTPVQGQTGALPIHAALSGLKSLEGGVGGGRLLVGPLVKQPSTDAAFRASMKMIRGGYFDATPKLVGIVRSMDQSVTLALFTATLRQVPINGIVYSVFDPNAGSRIGVLFDHAHRFGKTFQPLMARFTASSPPPPVAPLQEVVSQDGTEAIRVPGNWQIQVLQGGEAVINGLDQARVIIRFLTYFTEPNFPTAPGTTPMKFTADPTAAFSAVSRTFAEGNHQLPPEIHIERTVPQPKPAGTVTSALLYGTAQSGEITRRFQTLVQVAPVNAQGRWIVQINQISSPADVFQRGLPLLRKIVQSYRYDPQKMARVIIGYAREQREKNNRIFQDSMQRAATIQGNIDRSTAAFVDYIGDKGIVTNGSVAGKFNAETASAIVEADPQHFRILSLNEYQ